MKITELKNDKKITVIEAPFCLGSSTFGSDTAFTVLKDGLSLRSDFDFLSYPFPRNFIKSAGVVKNLDAVKEIIGHLTNSVSSVLEKGRPFILLGGDHSVAISSIMAISKSVGKNNLAVLYFDAHADINTEKTSPSGNAHGMPLAVCMGLCKDELAPLSDEYLLGKNTFLFGTRNVDDGEKPILKDNGVFSFGVAEMQKNGEDVLKKIASAVQKKYVHLSFDVDVIDEKDFPATGCKEKDGFSYEQIKELLKTILKIIPVSSADFVEYNPTLDKDGKSKEKCDELLKILADGIKK